MTKVKVYTVGTDKYYYHFIENAVLVNTMEEADIVLFTGGEDVHPSLYMESKGSKTVANISRDLSERDEFKEAQILGKFCLGICRGAQFLTVMSGGKLIQHVNNHGIQGTHDIEFFDGEILPITSTHHQMCYPMNLPITEYSILAHTKDRLSTTYLNNFDEEFKILPSVEPEIIFYYVTNSLGIQGHPEAMEDPKYKPTIDKINKLINECRNFRNARVM